MNIGRVFDLTVLIVSRCARALLPIFFHLFSAKFSRGVDAVFAYACLLPSHSFPLLTNSPTPRSGGSMEFGDHMLPAPYALCFSFRPTFHCLVYVRGLGCYHTLTLPPGAVPGSIKPLVSLTGSTRHAYVHEGPNSFDTAVHVTQGHCPSQDSGCIFIFFLVRL